MQDIKDITKTRKFQQALAEERRDRAEREAQLAQEAEDRKQANEDAREERKAKLADEKREREAKREAEWELALASDKQRLMREWLVNNFGKNAVDFELRAWQHLKANLIEVKKREAEEQQMAALRATGNYRM